MSSPVLLRLQFAYGEERKKAVCVHMRTHVYMYAGAYDVCVSDMGTCLHRRLGVWVWSAQCVYLCACVGHSAYACVGACTVLSL